MIQAKCIEKYRDNQGRIYGYKLIDLNGQTQDVKSENLKKAIANKSIHVVNLTLTSDNRLVDTTEKQLQSKELGEKPAKKFTKKQEKLLKIAKIIAKNFTYHIDESSIEDDRVQLHRKYMFKTYIQLKVATRMEFEHPNKGTTMDDLFSDSTILVEIPNTYIIYVGSDEIPFETDGIQFVADKDGIGKMLNTLKNIIHLFTRVSGCTDLLKLAYFIARNKESNIEEANLCYSLLEELAKVYNIGINSVMNLIQERIDYILKNKSYLQELREKVTEESKYYNNGNEPVDTEEEDKAHIDILTNAAVCYAAITLQKEEAYLNAHYFHKKSDLDYRFEYNRLVDNTEKQLQSKKQIIESILKGIIYNIGSEYIVDCDKQYKESCDSIDTDDNNNWYIYTSIGGLSEFSSASYFSALKITVINNTIDIKQYLAMLEYGNEEDDRIEKISKQVFNGKDTEINIQEVCNTIRHNTSILSQVIKAAEQLTSSIELEVSDSDNFAESCKNNTSIANARKVFVNAKLVTPEQFDNYILYNFDEDETIIDYIKSIN